MNCRTKYTLLVSVELERGEHHDWQIPFGYWVVKDEQSKYFPELPKILAMPPYLFEMFYKLNE